MESIKDAIARAKQNDKNLPGKSSAQFDNDRTQDSSVKRRRMTDPKPGPGTAHSAYKLDRALLQDMRIIAYDGTDRRTGHYDMLRTQVLQILQSASVKTIAVTSPRAECGKTVTSINLAFSIARQREQSVMLVDLDLRKPAIARYLGIRPRHDVMDVLEGRLPAVDASIFPDLGQTRLSILTAARPVSQSAETVASHEMKRLTEALAKDEAFTVVVYDLPPMLSTDDFLAFLPQVDCAMLVASVGETTEEEVKECERLIGEDKFLGCVLNKAAVADADYGYGG